jgi:hypothetical protein
MFALRQLLRGFAAPAARARQAAAAAGLALDRDCPNRLAEQLYITATRDECRSDTLRLLHRCYDSEFVSRSSLPGGKRNYAALEQNILSFAGAMDTPEDCEVLLNEIADDWEHNYRHPFASAFYGTVLAEAARVWRADATDDDLLNPRWQTYQRYLEQARTVFRENAPKPDQCPFWHRMYFGLSLVDGSTAHEQQIRFERAVAFDPLEPELYCQRMQQLAIAGGSAAMDDFAMTSIHDTRAEMGTAIYAKLYAHISDWEPLPATQVNYNILRNSFFDWQRKNKSQFVTNALVSAAFDFDDIDTIKSLWRREWTEFHANAWSSNARAAAALEMLAKSNRVANAA